MAIMGFGGGAMIGAPLKKFLLDLHSKAPEYLGTEGAVSLITENGRRFAEIAGEKVEVVVATATEAAQLAVPGDAGVYVVGTGNTGAAGAFLTLGIVYFIIMIIAAFQYRVPAEGWKPEGYEPPSEAESAAKMKTLNNVHINQAIKTPQFYQLWIVLCFNVSAGIGVIGVAKTMMSEIFGSAPPTSELASIVTAAFAGTYVLMISVFNMCGRIIWASLSDFIGRKNTYHCFFVLGTLLYLSIPFTASAVSVDPKVMYLVMFYAATMIIFTMYGGGFATIPAYLADIFGTMHVGGIHGRLLTAWSTAGVIGPVAIAQLRSLSYNNSLDKLMESIDPKAFLDKFGAPIEQLDQLVKAKTVTISKLMEIAPPGTVDPTPSLYNTTMYAMAGLLIVAFFSNLLMKPVHSKHFVENTHPGILK